MNMLIVEACIKIAKKSGTILDVANILGVEPKQIVGTIDELVTQIPGARPLLGHWPRESTGYVFVGDRFDTTGENSQRLKRGQHVFAEPLGRNCYEILDKYRNFMGVVQSQAIKKL